MLKSLEENIREGCAIMDPVMNERKSHGGVHNSPVNIGNNIALSTKIKDPKCSRDPQSAIFLKTLNEQAELCPKKIEEERVKISRLNGLIEGTQRKILMQRSRKGGIEDSQENSKAIAKQISILESRLDNAIGQLNEGQEANRQVMRIQYLEEEYKKSSLRERIDCLRRERVTFDRIYKRLENDLHRKRKEMGVILEESIMAYKAREKAHSDLKGLRQQAENDKQEFEDEWKKLGRLVEQVQLRHQDGWLVSLRSRERCKCEELQTSIIWNTMKDGESVWCRIRHQKLHADATNQEQPSTLTTKIRNTAMNTEGHNPLCFVLDIHGIVDKTESKTTGSFTRDQILSHERSQRYQSAFNEIQEITGESDIREAVNIFMQAEDSKFSLVNLINDLNCEIERLHRDVESTKTEIDKAHGSMGTNIDIRKLNSAWKVEAELADIISKAEKQEAAYENVVYTLQQLKAGIQSTCNRLNASSVDIISNQGISEGNMLHYLALIEKQETEILQAYVHSKKSIPGTSTVVTVPSSNLRRLTKETTKDTSKKAVEPEEIMIVHPPGLQDVNSDNNSDGDDSMRPLTRAQLKQKKNVKDVDMCCREE